MDLEPGTRQVHPGPPGRQKSLRWGRPAFHRRSVRSPRRSTGRRQVFTKLVKNPKEAGRATPRPLGPSGWPLEAPGGLYKFRPAPLQTFCKPTPRDEPVFDGTKEDVRGPVALQGKAFGDQEGRSGTANIALENRRGCKPSVGSNPTSSATFRLRQKAPGRRPGFVFGARPTILIVKRGWRQ